MQIVDVAFEGLTLNRQGPFIIVALDFFSINSWLDNLAFILVSDLVQGTLDAAHSSTLLIAEVVSMAFRDDVFEVDEALLRHDDVVVLEEVRHVDLLRCHDANILQVTCSKLEVVIVGLEAGHKAQLVLFEGLDNGLKKLSLRVLKLLGVNKDELVLEQFS